MLEELLVPLDVGDDEDECELLVGVDEAEVEDDDEDEERDDDVTDELLVIDETLACDDDEVGNNTASGVAAASVELDTGRVRFALTLLLKAEDDEDKSAASGDCAAGATVKDALQSSLLDDAPHALSTSDPAF